MVKKCVTESDHNPLVCKLKIKWDSKVKIKRKEVFKLKDKESLKMFQELTSKCPKLVQFSQKSSNFLEDAEKWMNKIQDIMHTNFKKIRITGKRKENPELETLMKVKRELRGKLEKLNGQNEGLENRINENIAAIENEISMICTEKYSNIVKEHIGQLSDDGEHVCRLNMWRLKHKLCPRNVEPPMAKKAANGDLISNPDDLKKLYVDTYKQRLRHRTIRPGYEQLETLKNYLFNIRLGQFPS